jgi:hypothetical protein
MKKSIVAFLFLLICVNTVWARENPRARREGVPTSQIIDYKPAINVNQIRAFISNDARLFQQDNQGSTNPGLFFPANTQNGISYLMSPFLACQYEGNASDIRTAAVENSGGAGSEYQPGPIVSGSDPVRPTDFTDPKYRLYIIRTGDDENSNPDYRDWPFSEGAPYRTLENFNGATDSFAVANPQPNVDFPIAIDKDGNQRIISSKSQLDALAAQRVLVPKLFGAVTAWCVYNDLKTPRRFSSRAMGCEVQQTIFAYSTSGPIGRSMFIKFKIFNRNRPDPARPTKGLWQRTSLAIFNDNDIGGFADDALGVDTLRNLGYTYNRLPQDQVFGERPPALGVDFFQGPFVRQNVPFLGQPRPVVRDTRDSIPAFIGDNRANIANIKKGQPLTSPSSAFVQFVGNGGPCNSDPANGRADQVYNYLTGRDACGNQLAFTQPGSGFMFPGDPETGQGIIDATITGDRRQLIVIGPFDVFAGESQDIVVGVQVAVGTNHRNSVTVLKRENSSVQNVFDNNFKVPTPPTVVPVITSLSNEIILNWENFSSRAESYTPSLENNPLRPVGTRSPDDRYTFQGYNVYQYEIPSGKTSGALWQKIATFDVIDSITTVIDRTEAVINGQTQITVGVVQNGTNTGIQRSLRINRDVIRSGAPLANGSRYYFAVTAYYVNKFILSLNPYPPAVGVAPQREEAAVLEGLETIVTAVPQAPVLGTVLPNATGDLVRTDRELLLSDDNVKIRVDDPARMVGANYKVRMINDSLWQLRDVDTDTIVRFPDGRRVDSLRVARIRDYTQQSLEIEERRTTPPILNGIQVTVRQNITGLRNAAQQGGGRGIVYLPAERQFFEPKDKPFGVGRAGASTPVLDSSAAIFDRILNASEGAVVYPRLNFMNANTSNPGVGTATPVDSLLGVALVFTDLQNGQFAYRYVSNLLGTLTGQIVPVDPAFLPFIDTTGVTVAERRDKLNPGGTYQGLSRVPFRAFEVTRNGGVGRQLNVLFSEWSDSSRYGFSVNGRWDPSDSAHGGAEFLFITKSSYDTTLNRYKVGRPVGALASPRRKIRTELSDLDIQYALWVKRKSGASITPGDTLKIIPNYKLLRGYEYAFSTNGVKKDDATAGQSKVAKINVFPNPYFASSSREQSLRQTFVTFSNLPSRASIRIFTLSGEFVRKIDRNNPNSSIEDWNLRNFANIPVASGMYIVQVETDFGTKVLKLAVIMREEREDLF